MADGTNNMSKPESVCKTYAERIVKDLKLDGWFMKEQVKHIFSPEIKNIAKTLAMMARFGFVEIELVKNCPSATR
jgi:tRNA A58 N-methylase Trm61